MDNREKIIELIFDDNEDAFTNWIVEQPLILQPDILREFRDITTELIKEAGAEEIPELEAMDKQTDIYEQSILDEQVAAVNYELALIARDKTSEKITETMQGVRDYLMDCIVTKADNAIPMLELAGKIIKSEKENGFYEPENWKNILHLI